ncbi:MAG TPA: TetR/AcrR family transcriptional regulator [Acidimicrobiales bacterium]|nr:TetR/AcrR family transcriptional regulator [Acidimicrobiales bacterium]
MPQAPKSPPRARRSRDDIRERLLESALVEFGAKGFDGASTRSIAQRVDAHQPQINYHFASKEALWNAAVDHLFGLLGQAMEGVTFGDETLHDAAAGAEVDRLAAGMAEMIRRFVRFAAAHPELNQIMVHEATAASDRLTWMTERHVRPLYEAVSLTWARLRDAGVAAPIDPAMVHYVIVGAASLPYVNAPEARLLTGAEPTDPAWVEAHADGLVATLLPGHHPA